tara:strand:+ start:16632 stop:16850 length:219 start_codon:yes stop_codon:yes gene_type:complete
MANNPFPLTGSDLREIADACDLADAAAGEGRLLASPLIGRVEVYRPGTDGSEVIGHLVPFDDWYGFVPAAGK